MKIRTLVSVVIGLSSVTAFATASSPAGQPLPLADVVTHMESRYPGEVVAIRFDGSGNTRAHYHVDMRFPASGLAMLDVDALTLAIASREPAPLTAGSATLAHAVTLVAAHVPGRVVVAELNSYEGITPHYEIDVRLPRGETARLKVDPATRQIAWRSPAIIGE